MIEMALDSTQSANQAVVSPRHHRIPDQAWEAVRPTIKKLYIDENRHLTDVRKILETQHNFQATTKQYKVRFKKWSMWKNLSVQDARKLMQVAQSSDSEGKSTTIVRSPRGLELDMARVRRTLKRSNKATSRKTQSPPADFDPSNMLPATPPAELSSALECRILSPEPAASSPDFDNSSVSEPQLGDFMDIDELSILPPDLSGDFEIGTKDACHLNHSAANEIDECFWAAQRKLARSHEMLQIMAESDSRSQHFQSTNTLLAILEPVLGAQLCVRILHLLNFLVAFLGHEDIKFTQITDRIATAIHLQWRYSGLTEGETLEDVVVRLPDWVPIMEDQWWTDASIRDFAMEMLRRTLVHALDRLGVSQQTRSFLLAPTGLETKEHKVKKLDDDDDDDDDLSGLEYLEAATRSLRGPLTPNDLSSPGLSTEDTRPELAVDLNKPATPLDTFDFEFEDGRHMAHDLNAALHAALAGEYQALGFLARLTAKLTFSPAGRALTRCAWYCLFNVKRQTNNGLESAADNTNHLMRAVQDSACFREAYGMSWEDVSFLFR